MPLVKFGTSIIAFYAFSISFKIVYFGDSPKSDVFPPSRYRGWDTVAILEEMEAEEIHFQKHSVSHRLSFCNGQIAHHFTSNSLYSFLFLFD